MNIRKNLCALLVIVCLGVVLPAGYGQDNADTLQASLNVTVVSADGAPMTVSCRIERGGETVVSEKIEGEKTYRVEAGTYRVTVSALDREITQTVTLAEGAARGVLATFPLYRVELTAVSRLGKPTTAAYVIQRRDDRVALASGKISRKRQPEALYLETGSYVVVISKKDERFEQHMETGGRAVQRIGARFGLAVLFLRALVGNREISAYYELFNEQGLKIKAGTVYPEGVRVAVDPGMYRVKVLREVRSDVVLESEIKLRAGKEHREEANFLGVLELGATGIDGRARFAWYVLRSLDGTIEHHGLVPRDGYRISLDPGSYDVRISPSAYTDLGVDYEVSLAPGDEASISADLGGAVKIRFFDRERDSYRGYYRLYHQDDEESVLDESVIPTGEIVLPAAPGEYLVELAPEARSRRTITKPVSVTSGAISEVNVLYP